eukprot:s2031_g8.t1
MEHAKSFSLCSRLADEVLFDMIAAVDKYVEAAEEAETPVPVYALDLAGRQRTYVQKMAKETGLIGYGYNVEYNWGGLNSSRDTFMKHHWKLLEGAAATGSHPAVPMTTEVCVVQIMKEIADKFGDFEEAALSVANGNLADMQQLTQLNPEIIALLDIAAGWFGDPRDKTCEASESSLKRMKFGSRLPRLGIGMGNWNVPAPTTQMILDDLLNLLMPAVDDFLSALKGEDTAKVLETSNALLEVTENLKSQYLAGAASSELSVTRYDAISRQVMLVQKMLKDALVVVYQAGDGNVSSRETLQSTIDDFAAMHLALKDGGRGMEPVISREDILEQWALIDAAWAGLQPLLSTTNPLDVPEMAAAANALEVELLAAIPLYAIPDNPKPPELLWSALAYIGISCFVVGVCCAACCVLYSAHRRRKKEAAEAASTDAVIPPMERLEEALADADGQVFLVTVAGCPSCKGPCCCRLCNAAPRSGLVDYYGVCSECGKCGGHASNCPFCLQVFPSLCALDSHVRFVHREREGAEWQTSRLEGYISQRHLPGARRAANPEPGTFTDARTGGLPHTRHDET